MARPDRATKLGYCESCAENTHFLAVAPKVWARPIQWLTSSLGYGPWYCQQCRGQRWKVHRALPSHAGGTVEAVNESGSVSVGNFIRGESNLVMQSTRSSRFSEKFRIGVVQRVLDGKQSLSQIADELNVPQADILVWVAQQFANKQEQIDQLSRTVQRLSRLASDQARIETRFELEPELDNGDLGLDDDVIDGRVNQS